MTEKYSQVVLNPGNNGSYWDSGDSPMSLEEWTTFLSSKGESVDKVKALAEPVEWKREKNSGC